jgi:hypothetical protein
MDRLRIVISEEELQQQIEAHNRANAVFAVGVGRRKEPGIPCCVSTATEHLGRFCFVFI